MKNKNILEIVYKILKNRKSEKIKIINISYRTIVSTYFIICTASSITHIKSILKYLGLVIKKQDMYTRSAERTIDKSWILIDLGNIIIHVMIKQTRKYYRLEKLWNKNNI
jgi:ribosome-associated protein